MKLHRILLVLLIVCSALPTAYFTVSGIWASFYLESFEVFFKQVYIPLIFFGSVCLFSYVLLRIDQQIEFIRPKNLYSDPKD